MTEIAAAVIGFALGFAVDEWRRHRQTERDEAAEQRLLQLEIMLSKEGPTTTYVTGGLDPGERAAIELGARRGVLTVAWHQGSMHVRFATIADYSR